MTRKSTRWLALVGLVLCTVGPALLLGADEPADTHEAGGLGAMIVQIAKTAFWGIVAFVIVLWILWKKAFPPIVAALDRREKLIQESLDAAERAKREAAEMIARHEESLEKARGEARAIIEEGKADASRVKEGILASARKESEELTQRARREIDLAKKAAVDDLYRQAAKLSFEIAEKVIRKDLKAEDHQELIGECIERYEKEID